MYVTLQHPIALFFKLKLIVHNNVHKLSTFRSVFVCVSNVMSGLAVLLLWVCGPVWWSLMDSISTVVLYVCTCWPDVVLLSDWLTWQSFQILEEKIPALILTHSLTHLQLLVDNVTLMWTKSTLSPMWPRCDLSPPPQHMWTSVENLGHKGLQITLAVVSCFCPFYPSNLIITHV